MSAPSSKAITNLYQSSLRTAKSFSSYNFREYFVRRTEYTFKAMREETDQSKVSTLYNEAVKEHTVLQRSAIVNQLYGGWKLVVEKQELVHDRGDT